MKKYLYFILAISMLLPLYVSAKQYKGGELRTKESYTYGRFEVCYKSSAGCGQTSTFFTYHDFTSDWINNWNELDIEILGRYTDDIQFNAITPGRSNHVHHHWVDFNPSLDFHTYAIEWTPDYVAWFIDGEEAYRQTGEHVSTLDKPQKIMMNIWNPVYEGWVGSWDNRILPLFAYYDWVSYASYTPGEGNTGTNNEFKLEWTDNFNTWDQSRWDKATHTFEGNNCDFLPENIVFRDGMMILCLTDNENTGYVDHNPPAVLWARAYGDTVEVVFSEDVEETSAEKTSNYAISGVTVSEAKLQSNNRTVKLTVSDLDFDSQYNLVVLGIKDKSETPNNLIGQVVSIVMSSPLPFPVKINVGGFTYNDYLSDQEWSENVEYGYLDGEAAEHSNQQIQGTEEDQIYRTEHRGIVGYKVRVPNGVYKVTLMMAENYFNEDGSRVFDINIEGNYIARNIDIFQEVGANAAFNIVVDSVNVADQTLDIHFGAIKDNALLNGLIVEAISADIHEENNILPNKFYLEQNHPNPFNSFTTIEYGLAESSFVSMRVYDICGREIESLIHKSQRAGVYEVTWQTHLSSGIYFYKIEVVSKHRIFTEIKKMLLIK